jgi:hypothetical protein
MGFILSAGSTQAAFYTMVLQSAGACRPLLRDHKKFFPFGSLYNNAIFFTVVEWPHANAGRIFRHATDTVSAWLVFLLAMVSSQPFNKA